jgi:acetylornithine deacetylase
MPAQRYTPYEMIERLIGFDTTSRLSNLALIDFIADYLAGHGVDSTRVFDDSGQKANLYATIGPEQDGGVVLSGHTDVVPVDGQDWSSDPFTTVRRDGKLFGRGTADMKSFFAIALALVPDFHARGINIPVHFALSYDEEVGCLGAPRLVSLLKGLPYAPKAVIVGEPTLMKLVDRHKGAFRLRTTVTGLEVHSAYTDRGVSAILFAGRVIAFLDKIAAGFRAAGDPDSGFDPPYHTLHVGTIHGGTAENIVPRHCVFDWETRMMPGGEVEADLLEPLAAFVRDELLPEMHAVSPETGIVTERLAGMDGLAPMTGSAAEVLVRQLTGDNSPAGAVSYGTEAGLFQRGGIPTVVCGPGSILQAHKADEYIEVAQVDACITFMHRLMDHCCAT